MECEAKVHYRLHKRPPLVCILRQLHQSTPSQRLSLRFLLILSSHMCLGLSGGLFPSSFPTKILYIFFSSPMRSTFPVHLIPLYLITLIIFSEAYKLWTSSVCSSTVSWHFLPLISKSSSQHPALRHPQSLSFP